MNDILAAEIDAHGPIALSRYLELALYHPQHGYYTSSASPRTGKSGDFFTSVSVGPLFGRLLAERIAAFAAAQNGQPIRIIELAAHDGQLTRDLASHLDRSSALANGSSFVLVEPAEALHRTHPSGIGGANVTSFTDLAHVPTSDIATVVISNELIDALPVDLYESDGQHWHELRVAMGNGSDIFCFSCADEPAEVLLPTASGFRPGTRAEYRPGVAAFAQAIASAAPNALAITIDYGFTRDDLYHPDRLGGTLTGYRDHQRVDDILAAPGSCDITAHVDFSQLSDAFATNGYASTLYATQSSYLTHLAKPLLAEMESRGEVDMTLVRQLQTLTHPGMLGRSFGVLECRSEGLADTPPALTGWRL